MAEAVGVIRVDLFANTAQWREGLGKAQAQLSAFAKSTEKTAKAFDKVGRDMSLAITAPLVLFGGAAIKAAADAQDLQGAFNVTFGNAAKDATAWAEATGDAMGRSTQRVQQTAIAFQELFEDFAPTEASAVRLTQAFTVLTEDLAAFKDISRDQALDILRNGLAGSAKGLKRFGIDISDAKVQQKAFELGIADANAKLTEQQKVLARAAIILEGTKKIQGEVQRSQGETAEETIRAKEAFNELLVTVGNDLLPVFNEFLKFAHEIISAFNDLSPEVRKTILVVGGIAAVAGPAALAIGGLLKVVGLLTKGLGFLTVASKTAAGGVTKLGLSAAGAIGWFAALAPVAHEAGKAIADAFYDDAAEYSKVKKRAYDVRDALVQMGYGANEATAAVQKLLLNAGGDLSKVNVDAAKKILGTATSFRIFNTATLTAATGVKEVSEAEEAADTATSSLTDEINALLSSFGNLGSETEYTAAQLQKVRDAVDPVGAALREYRENLTLASAAGVDAAEAQHAFGLEMLRSVGGVDEARKQIERLPPAIRDLIKELDALEQADLGQKRAGEQFKDFFANLKRSREEAKNEAERAAEQFAAFAEDLTLQFDPAAKFKAQMDKIDAAFKAGKISADVYKAAKDAAFADTPEGQQLEDALKERGRTIYEISDALADAATGARDFGDAIKQLIIDGLKTSILKPIFNDIVSALIPMPGAGGGGGFDLGKIGSNILSGIGNLFGGFRAEGGPVMPGRAYVVGEKRPEVFVPDQKGQILPQAGGTTIVQNFNGTLPDQHSRRQAGRQARLAISGAG